MIIYPFSRFITFSKLASINFLGQYCPVSPLSDSYKILNVPWYVMNASHFADALAGELGEYEKAKEYVWFDKDGDHSLGFLGVHKYGYIRYFFNVI